MKYSILLGIFLIGYVSRVYFASLAPQTLIWDMASYDHYARLFLDFSLPIDCCFKNLGYSAFLAGVYVIAGVGNSDAVRFVNIVLDMLTAVFLFIAMRRFGGEGPAWWSAILYCLNPFTASYTGLTLAENLTACILGGMIVVLSGTSFRDKYRSWVLFGVLCGLFIFVRQAFSYIVLVLPILLVFFSVPASKKKFLICIYCGLVLGSSYSLIGNLITFKTLAVAPPYTMKSGLIYMNFYRARYPELDLGMPNEAYAHAYATMAYEYAQTPLDQKKAWEKKYDQIIWKRLPMEWPSFVMTLIWNDIWMWDKDHLLAYHDPFYPRDMTMLRVINAGYLLVYAFGIVFYVRNRRKGRNTDPILVFSLALLVYMLFLFPLVTNETRHTLVYYPFLCFWGGYSVYSITYLIRSYLQKRGNL